MRRASAVKLPTGGVELLRRLVFWLSNTQPVACLDPFPFINEYARIRPWDARGIHNAELFPMLAEDGILAILFPYTPVGFETSLLLSPPAHATIGSIRDIWSGVDLTAGVSRSSDGSVRVPISFPKECELMAVWADFDTTGQTSRRST